MLEPSPLKLFLYLSLCIYVFCLYHVCCMQHPQRFACLHNQYYFFNGLCARDVAQLTEYLPNMHEALISNLHINLAQ